MSKSKIVITGVAGLLGSHLVKPLLRKGYSVLGIDNYNQGREAEKNIAPYFRSPDFTFVEKDILARDEIMQLCSGTKAIFHLAAEKIPRYSSSLRTLEVNIKGTEILLDAAKEQGARFFFGSSDEVYGKNAQVPLGEESMLVYGLSHSNRWSLGVSKMFCEHLCFAYQEKYSLPVTILRYSGGYGPTHVANWGNSPITIFLQASLKKETIPVHGDGTQTRSFTHIDDLVDGTMKVFESTYVGGEILNLGSENEISIINLAYLIWRETGGVGKPNIQFIPYTDFSNLYEDVQRRTVDYSKARFLVGYNPTITIEEGVHALVSWHKRKKA
jgi:UDP-glucose 4-epimerase